MFRFRIHLSYQGTAYHGWQIQPNANTVQAELNKALSILFRQNVDCVGCGRTDTGVHAKKYTAHFDLLTAPKDCDFACYKLNSILPKDIAIEAIEPVSSDFHARFDALHRSYKYFIHQQKNPFLDLHSSFVPYLLDIKAMNEACQYILGYHDFSSFSKSHTDVSNNFCTILSAHWEIIDHQLVFSITANRFLRNMVRAVVGTMCAIGTGKQQAADMVSIIEAKNRKFAGTSVDAKGLFLWEIQY